MARIVVVGSLNMDLVLKVDRLPLRGETVTAESFRTVPGGKGGNQAVAAARLGAQVDMIGRVGRDSYGEVLVESLRSNGVGASLVVKDPDCPTGVALITVDGGGGNTIVVYQGANGCCSPQDIDYGSEAILRAHAVVAQLEIPVGVVERAFDLARTSSAMTVLNPAPARDLPRRLLSNLDFIIPNEVEASSLSGVEVSGPDSAVEAARRLSGMGPKRVVISLGEQGAVFLGPEGTFHVPAFRVRAVDSTAAGDAFIAAFTVAWMEGAGPMESLRYACAAGALATTKVGAQPSLPAAREVEEMLSSTCY